MKHKFGSFGANPSLSKGGIDLSLFPSVENSNAQVIQLATRGSRGEGKEREKEKKVLSGGERGDVVSAINTARTLDMQNDLNSKIQVRLDKLIEDNFNKNTFAVKVSEDMEKMMDAIIDAANGKPLKTSITEQRQNAELMRPFMDRLLQNMEEGVGRADEPKSAELANAE